MSKYISHSIPYVMNNAKFNGHFLVELLEEVTVEDSGFGFLGAHPK